MQKYCLIFLSLILFFLLSSHSSYSADFNIKLRKTDINQLKQQLMPAFEENIRFLNRLLSCLEQGKFVDICLERYSVVDENNNVINKERNEQLRQSVKKNISENKLQQEQIIFELKKLLAQAEKVKRCLYQGQTANELKDCVIQYDKLSN